MKEEEEEEREEDVEEEKNNHHNSLLLSIFLNVHGECWNSVKKKKKNLNNGL